MQVIDHPQSKCWEHFAHEADVGIRGYGQTPGEAFENAGLAMTAVVTDPENVRAQKAVKIQCTAPDVELLFVDWLNAVIYEMSVRSMLFGDFRVEFQGTHGLRAIVQGETVDIVRHRPAVEIKGATYTGLKVFQRADGKWLAQCVVDV
jgi:SHS2 domain-containing protein